MSEFEKQYGEETNTPATYRAGASDYHSLRYVRWLEERLRKTAEMVGRMERLLEEMYDEFRFTEASLNSWDIITRVEQLLADIQKGKGRG